MLTILMRALEVLRDLLVYLPLSSKQLADPSNARFLPYSTPPLKDYVDKIVVERRFTARFVSGSGGQEMIFGLWYMVMKGTRQVVTTEGKKSQEAERVLALLNRLSNEI